MVPAAVPLARVLLVSVAILLVPPAGTTTPANPDG